MPEIYIHEDKEFIEKKYEKGIFGDNPNFQERFIPDYDELDKVVEAFRALGLNIVLTSGSFDLLHIGHAKYLAKAKEHGDVLIVGVDSDSKVQKRKGPTRPIIPENERTEIISHLRSVDVITLKYPDEPHLELIKRVHPDTLILTQGTYKEDKMQELTQYCGRVVCLEPQAETSTSAKIRKLEIDYTARVIKPIEEALIENNASPELIRKIGKLLIGEENGK